MSNIPVAYYGQAADSAAIQIKSKWWSTDKEEMHKHIFGVVKNIRQGQAYRQTANLRYARLYSNMEMTSLAGGQFAQSKEAFNFLGNRVSYNVIRSCVDTATAKIAKSKPRPLFLTEDGNWTLQERAKMLTSFVSSQFDKMGSGQGADRSFYGIGRNCFQDAGIFGTGVAKLRKDKKEACVRAERVFIDELVVDETEGRYRAPRQLHHVTLMHREVALDLWPKAEAQILAAPSGLTAEQLSLSSADMIEIIESWHLPSGPDAEDGKHVISIENKTLRCDDYHKDYFPFLFLRWALNPLGFFGRGIGEELLGIQLEINKLLRVIQIAQHLVAVPQVWLEIQSKTITKHINNQIGGVKYYQGAPPSFFTPTAMTAEIYNHLETLYAKAYEITGISMLSAGGRKPAGLDAAVALREYQDIESERFSIVSEAYQDFYIDATHMLLDMNRDLVKEGCNPMIQVQESGLMRNLRFSEVDIDPKSIVTKAYPTNLLPTQPAGKMQKVQELTQGGFFTQEEALDLMDFPDIQKVTRTKLAPKDAVIKVIEFNIQKGDKPGKYIAPEPYMNLTYAKTMAQSYYLRGRADGMPEAKLELIQRFMDDVQTLIDKEAAEKAQREAEAMAAQQAAMAPPPPPPALPDAPLAGAEAALPIDAGAADLAAVPQQGVAAPAPVNDLVPQV